jgi:ubiquinone/menaquinone biosynthesis C-methylase UbiE
VSDFLGIQAQTGWGKTLRFFAEWCQPQPGWLCLDAGSGPGLLAHYFMELGCRAIGFDRDWHAFSPQRLHPHLAQAQAEELPFVDGAFHLVAASNLLFLVENPQRTLAEMVRTARAGGLVAVLNPSEHMSLQAAQALADQYSLQGLGRDSLLNWARRAEAHRRWNEREIEHLFRDAGLRLERSELRIGPGLARLAAGRKD